MVRNPVAVQSLHQSTPKNSAIMSMRTIERNNWSCAMWGTDTPLIRHSSLVKHIKFPDLQYPGNIAGRESGLGTHLAVTGEATGL